MIKSIISIFYRVFIALSGYRVIFDRTIISSISNDKLGCSWQFNIKQINILKKSSAGEKWIKLIRWYKMVTKKNFKIKFVTHRIIFKHFHFYGAIERLNKLLRKNSTDAIQNLTKHISAELGELY